MPLYLEFLNFPICECKQHPHTCPFHERMIEHNLLFEKEFTNIKEKLNKAQLRSLENHMLATFIVYTEEREDIGWKRQGKALEIIENSPHLLSPVSDTKTTETWNLCNACNYLTMEAKDQSVLGLLEASHFIPKLHEHLMKGLLPNPGKLSTNIRFTTLNGQRMLYPTFSNTFVTEATLLALVDKLNALTNEVKALPEGVIRTSFVFKLASLLLCSFLALHVFSDGNGRTGRLLASYVLLLVSPFMIPCVLPRDKFLDRLVTYRSKIKLGENVHSKEEGQAAAVEALHQKPAGLCAALLESNYSRWQECSAYLSRQGIKLQAPRPLWLC